MKYELCNYIGNDGIIEVKTENKVPVNWSPYKIQTNLLF